MGGTCSTHRGDAWTVSVRDSKRSVGLWTLGNVVVGGGGVVVVVVVV